MSSLSVHQRHGLHFDVLEDWDDGKQAALPGGLVPQGPLLRLRPENETFDEPVHVVMPVCCSATSAYRSTTADSGWEELSCNRLDGLMITSLLVLKLINPHFYYYVLACC